VSLSAGSFNFSRPRKQISARAVLISGVSPPETLAKIPDIRIELRSKRIPGKRDDELFLGAKVY
jgi:hypothetical protein